MMLLLPRKGKHSLDRCSHRNGRRCDGRSLFLIIAVVAIVCILRSWREDNSNSINWSTLAEVEIEPMMLLLILVPVILAYALVVATVLA